jgi:hypothetical protein
VCDGSPLGAVLIIRRGSWGGLTLSSMVTTGKGDPSERRALHALQRCPSHGLEGSPLSSDVCLLGGEHSADPAIGAAHPVASALPWMTSTSRAEIGGSRDS